MSDLLHSATVMRGVLDVERVAAWRSIAESWAASPRGAREIAESGGRGSEQVDLVLARLGRHEVADELETQARRVVLSAAPPRTVDPEPIWGRCVFRLVDPADPAAHAYTPRHRDGQFAGPSVNVVIPLTEFGGRAPGIAFEVPKFLRDDGKWVDASSRQIEMEPGDVMLLGSEVLHWRWINEAMTVPRLSIEWRVRVT